MATKDTSLKIPGPSSTERSGKDSTKDPKAKCFGLNEGNLRQSQDQNLSFYFLPRSLGQRMTVETGLLLLLDKLIQGNSFQGRA